MRLLNIGILAHVDAGKTSLTERLLFDTGVIDRLGRVDAGDTQTDTNEIERERGITIRTAVASFRLGDLQVNLIDTPGHSDFIAEVERALGVLDAAILVLSAVEGVQPHTWILMKTLRRLRLPTLIFVNKIDRLAARDPGLVSDIQRKLLVRVVPLNTVTNLGSAAARTRTVDWADPAVCIRAAEVLAEAEEALLQALVEETAPSCEKVQSALAKQTADASAHPLVFGSALTGAGVDCLLDSAQRFLPAATQREGALAGVVFSLTRNGAGEKLGYVRLFSGQVRNRQRVAFWRIDPDGNVREHSGRITSLEVVGNDARPATAGNIAKVGGLAELRVGDRIGLLTTDARPVEFPRPDFESVVKPNAPADVTRLRSALMSLAEQDPLMQVRPLSGGGTSVLLYGEVQREVLAATLHNEFGIDADFAPPRIVHIERPLSVGEAMEARFGATIRLRIEPGPAGSGIVYQRARLTTSLLLPALLRAIEETAKRTLKQGLYGWPVTDCVVTLVHGECEPLPACDDFRRLTPLVLLSALAHAGTAVFEPCHRFELELPQEELGPVISRLAGFEAIIYETSQHSTIVVIHGEIPVRQLHPFRRLLTDLTHGEGVWHSRPEGDRRVNGAPPRRERFDGNPLDRKEYMEFLRKGGRCPA